MNTPIQIQLGNPTEQPKKNYFNIHTNGIGRVTRVRTVASKGKPFLACTIEAFAGGGNGYKPKSRYFEVNVAGEKALSIIPQIEQFANSEQHKVYIGFCVGDLWSKIYARDNDQQGICTKGRLLYVDWVKVDNQPVYQVENSRIPMPDMTDLTKSDHFFELTTTGTGYLSNIRTEATIDLKDTFLTCNIGALVGENSDNSKPEYRYFNVRVYDNESTVSKMVSGYQEALSAGSKVMIGFKVQDIWSKIFTYHKGENAGKPGVAFNSQLIELGWVRIDGEIAYKKDGNQALPATDSANEKVLLQPSPATQAAYSQPNARQPVPVTTVQAESSLVAPVAEQVMQQPVIQLASQPAQLVAQQSAPEIVDQAQSTVEQTIQQPEVQGQATVAQAVALQPVTVATVQAQAPEVVAVQQPLVQPEPTVQETVLEQAIEPAMAEPAIQVQEPVSEITVEQPVTVEQPSSTNAA